MWAALCFTGTVVACILAIAVPVFSDLIGIAAALFAAWYTYGLAGFFWLHDVYHLQGGMQALKKRWIGTTLAVLTIIAGAFICVAGTYVSIKVSWTVPYFVLGLLTNANIHAADCGCVQDPYRR